MSQHDDFDRSLARWFDAETRPAGTADVLDRALRATSRRRPRPGLFAALGSHWVGDSVGPTADGATLGRTGLRTSMALLLLLLVLVLVAGAVLIGARPLQPARDVPRLGHLAYVTEDGLYVADWDGRNPRRIVSAGQLPGSVPEGCREFWGGPTWSPDGRHLAIRTDWSDRCDGFILITDAEGSSLTTIPGSGWLISWSPDSSRIVTWVATFETIGVYGIDGERQALLPAPRDLMSSGDHDPRWTPDGAAALVPHGVVVPLDGTAPYVDLRVASAWRSRSHVSPDGTRILLLSGSRPRIVDVATGATTTLGLPNGESDVIRFSPGGDRILLSLYEGDGRFSLWSAQADGSGARQLVDGTYGGDWQWLVPGSASASPGPTPTPAHSDDLGIFEPVAGWIVYGYLNGIWGIDPAARAAPATRVLLTAEAGSPLGWSSDGTRLLITRGSYGEQRLFVLHADGSETQVTERPMTIRGATLSPDGSRVVYATVSELYAVDADGGPAEMLVESRLGILHSPTFNPGGTQIAYVDGRGDWGHSVWVVDEDGSNAHEILANETTGSAGHVYGLAWSPAGDRIALGLEGTTYTFAPDGSGFTRVISLDGDWPYWSPDGSQLAFDRGGLAIADADGSNVLRFGFGASGPWHPGTPENGAGG